MTQSCSSSEVHLKLVVLEEPLTRGQVEIEVEMINESSESITFLPWNTAMESPLRGKAFSVVDVRSGEELPYQGRMTKRRPPTASDYLTVNSGQTIFNKVVISNAYEFCEHGQYNISANPNIYNKDQELVSLVVRAASFSAGDGFKSCD